MRVPRAELEDRARLGRAARVVARAHLLRLGRPAIGEVAVEVVQVVGEEEGVRDAPAVEVDDAALGIELVEGALVLRQARHHHRRIEGQAVLAAKLHQLAIGAGLAHVARLAVAIDVGGLPERVVLVGAVVHRARADVAALLEHFLGAVGRNARDHVEERLPDRIRHVLRQGLAARLVLALVDGEDVLGHGQRHAGAADLGGVHVAVDPDGGADLVGIAADRQDRDVAALGGLADGAEADEAGMLLGPGGELGGEFGVVQVLGAEHSSSSTRGVRGPPLCTRAPPSRGEERKLSPPPPPPRRPPPRPPPGCRSAPISTSSRPRSSRPAPG